MQKKFEPKQNELKGQNDELEGLKKQMTTQEGKLNEDALATLKKQIESKQKLFDRSVQDAQEEFGNQQQEIASRILQKMAPMIVKYSQENGFGMIVDTSKPWPQSTVLWWDQADRHHQGGRRCLQRAVGRARACCAGSRSREAGRSEATDWHRDQARDPQADRATEVVTDTCGVQKVPAGRVKTRPFFLRQHRLQQSAWCPYQQTDFTLEDTMFADSMLETSWAQRTRRSWTTLTSFGLQALVIGLLLLLPLWKTVGLPSARVVSTPISAGRFAPEPALQPRTGSASAPQFNILPGRIMQPLTCAKLHRKMDDDEPASLAADRRHWHGARRG